MAGVNKVILLGNLGSDPEVKYLEGGSVVARFNIATSESYTNRNNERVEQTEWHRIELWDNLAKVAEQYLRKGNQVYVEGKIKSETWTDKDGQQRTGIRIRGTAMQLIGGGNNRGSESAPSENNSGGGQQQASAPRPAAPTPRPAAPDTPPPFTESGGSDSDDLPF